MPGIASSRFHSPPRLSLLRRAVTATGKSPAFQFYAAEYLADENVQLMTLEEEGCYIRMLAYCWREGSIPAEHKLLSRLCKNASDDVLAVVERRFEKQGTRLIHQRLERERKKQKLFNKKQRLAGIASGRARRQKKLDSEPKSNQRSDSVQTKTNSAFASSSSAAASTTTPLNPPASGGNGNGSHGPKTHDELLKNEREYSAMGWGSGYIVIRTGRHKRLFKQGEIDAMVGSSIERVVERIHAKGFWAEIYKPTEVVE
jgi:uncharacterized protein YdaU (DUF1376 family)